MTELTQSANEFEIVAENLSIPPAAARNARQQNGRWTFVVAKEQQQQAIQMVWAAGGTVLSLVPRTQTLEELFVRLMSDSSDRPSA
jgi:ABC-type uncharacterized transport system ATPase subunit